MAGPCLRQPGNALSRLFVKAKLGPINRAFVAPSSIVTPSLVGEPNNNKKRPRQHRWCNLAKPESRQIKVILTGGVALMASLVVLLLGATLRGGTPPWLILVEAMAIAALVAVASHWIWAAVPEERVAVPQPEQVKPVRAPSIELSSNPDYDPLTRTLNQRGIATKLLELMALGDRYGNKLSIAVAGVDHLKDVNDQWGRIVGDHVLRVIAEALTETVRMPDRLGRWGEDLFLVVLPETDLHGARKIAERFREIVAGVEIEADQRTRIQMTVSVGVTMYRRGDDLHGFLNRAVRAMEAAKNQGRNRVLTDLAA